MDDARELDPNRWLQEHGDIMFRYAISRVRDAAAAEDLVQETFLAGIKSKERFSGRSTERTWLIGILKHK
ncbi:MAG: sigma factor, partial [Verrucomicrobiota bacterium]